jgi:hypothetical protein
VWCRPSANTALDPYVNIETVNTTTCPQCSALIAMGGLVVGDEQRKVPEGQ